MPAPRARRRQIVKKLVQIWSKVFGGGEGFFSIGIDDDFFDLGGHSLSASLVIAAVHKEFNVKLPLGELFRLRTIRDIADYILTLKKDRFIPIRPVEKKEFYPLSSAQKRIYILQRMDPGCGVYNGSLVVVIEGRLNRDRLTRSFWELVNRHESLRTSFEWLEGEPVQRVQEKVELNISHFRVKRCTGQNRGIPDNVSPIIMGFRKPFDLDKAPLFRVGLVEIEADKQVLMVDIHHIISDGISRDILVKEFMALYLSRDLPRLQLQYRDFSAWKNERLQSGLLKHQEEYWLEKLSGELPVLDLPYDFPRPSLGSLEGERVRFCLQERLTGELKEFTRRTGTTLFMVLLAVYNILLSKYSGQTDIIIGSPAAGRTHADLENTIGLVIDTIVYRCFPAKEKTFAIFLEEIKETTLEANENQDYPFRELVKQVVQENDLTGNPLFAVMLNVLEQNMDGWEINGLKLTPYTFDYKVSWVDLTLEAVETRAGIIIEMEYGTKLFKRSTVEMLARQFTAILEQVLACPCITLAEIGMFHQDRDFLYDVETGKPGMLLHELVEAAVEKYADHTAVVHHDRRFTYTEMNQRANRLARVLGAGGVKPGHITAIMIEPCLEMIIGILAILKAGACYLPIDPEYPPKRVSFMLKDSSAGLLITKACFKKDFHPETILLDKIDNLLAKEEETNPERINKPADLAYIIYTSGSTGTPKGVMAAHQNAAAYVKAFDKIIELTPKNIVLQQASFSFDTYIEEVFPILSKGGKAAVPDKYEVLDIRLLSAFISRYDVDIIDCSPLLLNELNQISKKGNFQKQGCTFISGGDVLKKEYLDNLPVFGKVYNSYGPTETTICATYYECPRTPEKEESIPIGKPIPGYNVYIWNEHVGLLPIGPPGELCISGPGVTRGYLNRPELTKEKFDHDLWDYRDYHDKKNKSFLGGPGGRFFKKAPLAARGKLYKTGDLARWLWDGNIEFLGRIDHQVKIRGFRIECGEIENQLLKHGEIKEAVVAVRENREGEKHLCAYVVSTGAGVSSSMLREFLSRALPGYMVPAYFVMLEKMPLNPSGKMDVKALPEPGLEGRGVVYTAPRDEAETRLAEIWQEVLDLPAAPGIDDNFLDLGGHSLKATTLTARVHQVFQVELPLSKVLTRTTIRDLSEFIRQAQKSKYTGIEPVEEREYYHLSSAQKRLYFLQQMDLKSTAYNMPSALPLKKDIEIDKLGAILRKLILRHESLRTSFERMNETPVQRIHPPGEIRFEIEYYELSAPPSQQESYSQLASNIIKNFVRAFDLSRAPLIRSGIIQLADNQYIWLVDIHHIVSDGTSHTILTEDFMALYGGEGLEPLRLRYRDFSQWQNRLFETGAIKAQEDYWLELYWDAEEIPRLNLPTDYKRPEVFTFVGHHVEFLMEREEALAFKALGSRIGATLYMNILAVLNTLFYRYSGQADIIIGTGITGRPHADRQPMMGMFVNTLVMRNYPGGEKTYESFLKEVMAHSIKAFDNQDVQFEELVERLDVERDPSRNPLFDVCLVVENFRQVRETMNLPLVDEDLSIEYKHPTSKFDMTFFVLESSDDVVITIEYYTDVYKEETIKRLTSHFRNIIKAVTGDPSIKLKDIDIISQEEKQQMLYQWNDTAREYPFDKTAQELFEAQVEQTPDRIAVWTGSIPQSPENQRFITYRELNKRANQLANYLYQEKRIRPDDIVGILMDKSIHLVIAILGILKAGGAYVPIEPSTPEERIKTIINDARIEVVISRKKCIRVLNRLQWECDSFHTLLCMDSMEIHREEEGKVRSKGKYQEALTALQRFGTEGLVDGARSHSSDLAYVIYTSGTTGTPRGVMIRHRSLVNYVYWGIRQYLHRDKPGEVEEVYYFPLYTSISFDLTVTSIFLPLISGNTIVVYDHEQAQLAIFAVFAKGSGAVDIVKATPSHLKLLLSETDHKSRPLNRVKRFIVGGEAFETLLARDICRSFAGEVEIYNEYGPTEATVGCMIYRFGDSHDQRETVPIGVPVDNTMIFLLDRNLNPVPLNAVGELYIGGEGIARGYLNQPKLTAEKFIDYPITPLLPYPIYRTGDLARWLPNGNMEFLGRIDDQVKIRGYRIEIKEIEAQLLKHSDITEAVVISRDDGAGNGDTYLCAYITSLLKEVDPVGLKEYLSREVPDYMIPSYVVQLERIPLTPNGKVDRKALPKPGAKGIDENYPAPRNPVEKKLVQIWSEVLHVEKGEIGIDSNFFDLGGHSLRATVLIAKIHKELGIQVPLAEVFNRQTIRGLSGYIEHAPQCKYGGIVPVEKKEYYGLSSAQKRLYFLQQMDLNSTAYNMPLFLPLRDLQEDRLELALKTLIARHESLRTSFKMVNDVPVQKIHDQVKFSSNYYEIPGVEEVGDISTITARIEKIKDDFVYPFDLSQVPLLRSGIVKLPDNHHVWMVDIHHIVFDGTSHMIITEELMALLNGEELERLRLQYKDFSQWQNRLIGSGWMKAQEDYWLDLYWDAKEIPPLNLPVDDKRPETFTFVGRIYSFMLEGENAVKFRALGSRNGATLYMNILVLLNTLFYKYTGQTDIVIGSGIAGRPHDDLQLIIGMFVNTLAMRNHPEGEKTYESFLKEIVDHSIKAFENQDVQFEELVDKLELERNPSRNPLFDVTMVVQNFRSVSEGGKIGKREKGKGVIELPGVDENLPYVRYENTTSKFDLTFFIHEDKEDIHVNIEYYTAIFKQENIQRLVTHFKNIIKTVIKDPFIKLKDIDILSEEEKRQVLFEFNNTARVYPGDKTIPGLFEEQVEKAPDHTALVALVGQIPILNEISITYRELDKKANQLANYLYFEKNIQPEEAVGVLMERSILLLVSLLGILKAGGAYVPLDPDYPEERLKDIINDAGVNIVISRKNQVKTLNRLQWECPGFHTFLCLDSTDVYSEEEVEKSGLMDEKLWEYIGESATDDITGGGWLTGTTGQPFSREEMDEYGDNILKKLKPLLDKRLRVLEIGCASGITMYRLAPLVGFYYGTDLSRVIIEKNKEKVRQEGYGNIKLACLPAHEILQIKSEEKNFDLVIINSVIQSFHGHNYLRWVICQVLDLMADQGFLFIGDVMDQDLKGELIRWMKEFKRANAGKKYTTKTDWSEELFISCSFFEDLTVEFPGIHDVEFSGKIYTIENELTLFRYDVLLRVDKKAAKDRSRHKHKYQEDARVLQKYGTQKPLMFVTSHQLAYVIYTSGSSGKPKGVMIEHKNVGRLIKNTNFIKWGECGRLLPTGSIAFDISTFEIWGPLSNGAALVLVDKPVLLDGSEFEQVVHSHGVTHLHLIPQLFDQLASERPGLFGGLGYFLVGGDLVKPRYVNEIRKRYKDLTILHMYGPTENTTFSTFFPVDGVYEESLPIGRPIANSTVYILDRYQGLQPIGVAGELCTGGRGVARGYLNNPELTAEKFFSRFNRSYKSYRSYISKKIYKTGDLARWLKDSNIEFLGRIDAQVKIRGFRIELGEIESQLFTHDLIKDAVVIDKEEENGEKYLCAYIVVKEAIDLSDVKDFLSGHLPDYMMPSYVIPIDKIPVTPNGKVDRRSLPEPGYEGLGDEYIAPRDDVEEKLVQIWSEVLQVDRRKISIGTSFFDLGGHSLKATQLVSKIHKEFNINLPLAEVFKTPNIRALAAFIRKKSGSDQDRYFSIEPSEKRDRYALSSAQKRLYLIQQMDETSTGYNSPLVLTLEGVVDKKRLEETFRKLIQRHESFRTSFHMIDEAPVQRIHEKVEFEIEYYNLTTEDTEDTEGMASPTYYCSRNTQVPEKKSWNENKVLQHSNTEGGLAASLIKNFIRPFNLSLAPLLRVRLATHILMVDIHHIISDGLSNRILVEEFELFYNGQDLPPSRLQYKDFSGWQNQRLNTGELKKQEEFWQEEFKGEIPVLQLPMDFPRPLLRSFQGSCQGFEIPVDQLEKLWELAASEAVTMFTLLFTLYNVFLAKLSGQEDIIVGTVAAGRRHADLEPIIGMFVNTLALRNSPKGDITFKEFLKDVSRRTVNAFDNQDYQFEDLVGKVLAHRDITRNPLFDVVFNHFVGEANKSAPSSTDSPGDSFELKVSPYNRESTQTKFDLVLSSLEIGKQLKFCFYYSTCLFKKETIQRFVNYFKEILSSVLEKPDVKLEDITISYDLSLAAADEYKIAEGDFEF
ncbi:MAG: amino acid adenylation domain-containing protein [Candidatus Aminicenantes bacterium]|nr:MAG: amino acid adenylation domain-containing protein [Candidatus Aminicenantes bacterium]